MSGFAVLPESQIPHPTQPPRINYIDDLQISSIVSQCSRTLPVSVSIPTDRRSPSMQWNQGPNHNPPDRTLTKSSSALISRHSGANELVHDQNRYKAPILGWHHTIHTPTHTKRPITATSVRGFLILTTALQWVFALPAPGMLPPLPTLAPELGQHAPFGCLDSIPVPWLDRGPASPDDVGFKLWNFTQSEQLFYDMSTPDYPSCGKFTTAEAIDAMLDLTQQSVGLVLSSLLSIHP